MSVQENAAVSKEVKWNSWKDTIKVNCFNYIYI